MRHTELKLLILFGLALLFSGCPKEIDEFIPDTVELDFEEEFIEEMPEDVYALNGDSIVLTPGGTEFEIYAQDYEFSDGAFCLCNDIELQVLELSTPADFILSGKYTGSPQNLIAVEGMYFVSMTSMEKEIKLIEGIKLHYHDVGDIDSQLDLFYGIGSVSDPEWVPADQVPGNLGHLEFSSDIDGYETYIDRLGWSAVAKPLSGASTRFCISLDLLSHNQNTSAHLVGTDELFVQPMNFDSAKECFCADEVPVGKKVTAVVIRKSGTDAYQYAEATSEVTPNLDLEMRFDSDTKSQSQIIAQLRAL